MARSKKRSNQFGGIFFVDALASSVGVILLILFIFVSKGVQRNTPKVLSDLMKKQIEEGNLPIQRGTMYPGQTKKYHNWEECFVKTQNRQRPLARVHEDYIVLVWSGEVIRKDEFEEKKHIIQSYKKRFEDLEDEDSKDLFYLLIYSNGMYHFLSQYIHDLGLRGDLHWMPLPTTDAEEDSTGGAGSSGNMAESHAAEAKESANESRESGDALEDSHHVHPADSGAVSVDSLSGDTTLSHIDSSSVDSGQMAKARNAEKKNSKPGISGPQAPDTTAISDTTSQTGQTTSGNIAEKIRNPIYPSPPPQQRQSPPKPRPLTRQQQQAMQDPQTDELIEKYAQSFQQSQDVVSQIEGDTSQTQPDSIQSYQEFKKELVASGLLDSLKKLDSEQDSAQAAQKIHSLMKQHTIREQISNSKSSQQKKKFSKQFYQQVIDPYLFEKDKNAASRRNTNILDPDSLFKRDYTNPLTGLALPMTPYFERDLKFIIPLNRPLSVFSIVEMDSVTVAQMDTSLTLVCYFRVQPFPYAQGVFVVSKPGCVFKIDSLNFKKYDIPEFTYTWIPMKFTAASQENLFADTEVFLFGMVVDEVIILPKRENNIVFTDFEFEDQTPPDFFWSKILIGFSLVVLGIAFIIIVRRIR